MQGVRERGMQSADLSTVFKPLAKFIQVSDLICWFETTL